MPIFFSLSHDFKESTVATTFMETVQNLHGVPKIIVSEKDPIFIGNFWIELFSCLGTQLSHMSSYHLNPMGKLRLWINSYKDVFVVLHMINRHNGSNGFP